MESLELGVVTMEYNESGAITNASFSPTMNVKLDDSVLKQLEITKGTHNKMEIELNASLVLAAWFEKTNEIELSDREKYFIASDIVTCEHHENGVISKCVIKYFYQERLLIKI